MVNSRLQDSDVDYIQLDDRHSVLVLVLAVDLQKMATMNLSAAPLFMVAAVHATRGRS